MYPVHHNVIKAAQVAVVKDSITNSEASLTPGFVAVNEDLWGPLRTERLLPEIGHRPRPRKFWMEGRDTERTCRGDSARGTKVVSLAPIICVEQHQPADLQAVRAREDDPGVPPRGILSAQYR